MTIRPGTLVSSEYWIRCPFCGDSENRPDKCHFSFNVLSGLFHCHRCQVSGRFTRKQRDALVGGIENLPELFSTVEGVTQLDDRDPANDFSILLGFLLPGPGTARFSLMNRWHLATEFGPVDAFECRDTRGRLTGINLRPSWVKSFRTLGRRLLGYAGEGALNPVSFVRIVEGPYDVTTTEDCCLFGMPSFMQLKVLKGYPLVFCPDGDIWTDADKCRAYFLKPAQATWIAALAIEYLEGNSDPDEIAPQQRTWVDVFPRRLSKVVDEIYSSHHKGEADASRNT